MMRDSTVLALCSLLLAVGACTESSSTTEAKAAAEAKAAPSLSSYQVSPNLENPFEVPAEQGPESGEQAPELGETASPELADPFGGAEEPEPEPRPSMALEDPFANHAGNTDIRAEGFPPPKDPVLQEQRKAGSGSRSRSPDLADPFKAR